MPFIHLASRKTGPQSDNRRIRLEAVVTGFVRRIRDSIPGDFQV